jgi:UDP-glucose 4-epimerase
MPAPRVAIVTGGAGFIGSHMVDLCLARGMQVRVIDNLVGGRLANLSQYQNDSRLTVEQRDIRSFAPGDKLFAGATHVFHFGGIGDLVPSIEHPLEYLSVNVQGTVAMLECARQAGTVQKFVYAASSSCYGIADVPTTEEDPIRPEHPYALSKNLGEQACFHWHKVYRLPVNSIRIFNAYGTRSRTSGAYGAVFGVFLKQKLAGKPFTVVGDGTQRRDFLYVTDVARAFLAAGETGMSGRIWNVGAGNPQAVNRLVELLGGYHAHHDRAWMATGSEFRGWRREGYRRDRLLARCAAVGPRIDRALDQDLVRLSLVIVLTRSETSKLVPAAWMVRKQPA